MLTLTSIDNNGAAVNIDLGYLVENGEIVERGTHDNLIKLEGRYYDLYTYQARIDTCGRRWI